jgi:ribose transport system ATP-binding protein
MEPHKKKTIDAPLLEMRAITKGFPGVKALQDVDFVVEPGEIMALVGENGAGKSTLMKILNGVYHTDSGTITWLGENVSFTAPGDAQAVGIGMIHQELALINELDAGKNIYLGREPQLAPGVVNWGALYQDAQAELDALGLDINAKTPVKFYSIAQQQMIEVAKALSMRARLIVMDEPTSSLTDREVETLFAQMRALRERGVSIVFISHRMDEIFEICDRVTVLRDGQLVSVESVSDVTAEDIIRMMVGREVGTIYERGEPVTTDHVVLSVRNLSSGPRVQDVSFDLHRGEILAFAGLVGAGRTELAETIFGATPASAGTITLDGETVRITHPAHAIRYGIGLVPEDRKQQGLFLRMSVAANTVMAKLREMLQVIFIPHGQVKDIATDFIDRLNVRTPSAAQVIGNLSGGNQQKVVIAKWLTLEPRVLILDEPTRGIDVGAKAEIYRLMHNLAAEGVGIIMISSELPEVLGVSDRVLVMHEGRLTGEFDTQTATQDMIMRAATGTAPGKRGAATA